MELTQTALMLALAGMTVAWVRSFFRVTLPTAAVSPKSGPADTREVTFFTFKANPKTLPNAASSASPACTKLEAFLRLAGIPYTLKDADPSRAPKGKMPYIRHAGQVVGDSALIINYLVGTFAPNADRIGKVLLRLTDEQKAKSTLVQRVCEDDLFHFVLYSRWVNADGFRSTMQAYAVGLPAILRNIFFPMWRSSVSTWMYGHGYTRYHPDEMAARARDDIDALAVSLGSSKFFLGAEPAVVDLAVLGILESILNCIEDDYNGVRAHVLSKANLVAFVQHLREVVFDRK